MRRLSIVFFVILGLLSASALARDTTLHLSVAEAMASPDYQGKLEGVKFYFGDQPYPTPTATQGEWVSNKKTNAFNKTDEEACRWVLLSALLSLRDRALAEGGNAVVDIVSYYKRHTYKSDTEYECHAGAFVAGVALQGRVVTLPE